MESQTETWQDRQRRVLTELRDKAGLKQADVARLSGLDFWLYVRLETGKQLAKAKEIEPLAHAHDLDPHTLFDALREPVAVSYSPRAELEASGVVPDHYIEKLVADLYERSEIDQRAVVESTIRHYREARRQTGAG